MNTRLFLAGMAMLILSACDNTPARYSSDYATKLDRNEIVILPVYAEAYKVDATGDQERQYDYEGYIEPIISEKFQEQLKEKGYRVRLLHKNDLMKGKAYHEYGTFREAFKSAYEEDLKRGLMLKREEAGNSTIRLNNKGKALSEKVNAPLMAYVDYNETVTTSDAQIASFVGTVLIQALTGVNTSTPPDKTLALVAIIDGQDDKVLWMNKGGSAGGGVGASMFSTDDEQAREHIDNSLTWALKELPKREDLFKNEAKK